MVSRTSPAAATRSARCKDAWANYRDESFIRQFLSPRLIRQFRLFHVTDDTDELILRVDAIHNEQGYRRIRQRLSRQYDVAWPIPISRWSMSILQATAS